MLTVEGIIHHENGTKTSYLISPADQSWTQWGGTKAELGNARDYVHAMTLGLAEHSDYFTADAPLPAVPAAAPADTPAAPTEAADAPVTAPPLVIPADEEAPVEGQVVLDALPAAADDEQPEHDPDAVYQSFPELANVYALERYSRSTGELTKGELKAVKKAVKTMVAVAPHLLPAAERERYGL